MMDVLITGAAGEFGRDLTPWLSGEFNIRATDIMEPDFDCNCEFVRADLRRPKQVRELTEGIDAVIHLAALLPVQEYTTEEFMDVNVKATALLCEAAIEADVERLVFASSVWAAGHGQFDAMPVTERVSPQPQEMYGLTKLVGEQTIEYYARKSGLSALIMRLCGYRRCSQFSPEGTVDLRVADLGAIAKAAVRPGQKLYNPNDLGNVMRAALTGGDISFEIVPVGNHVPWRANDAEALKQDPVSVIEKYHPGARELFDDYGVQPDPVDEFYSTERSRKLLDFEHEYSPDDIIAAHEERN